MDDIFEDLIDISRNHGHLIKTMTVYLRKELLDKYWDSDIALKRKWMLTDLPMWLDISKHTKIQYIAESLATYRLLEESASRTTDPLKAYQFHLSMNDMRIYYMEKYSCCNNIKKRVEIVYYRGLISDAYAIKNKKLATTAYRYLKTHTQPTVKERLAYWGASNRIFRCLLSTIIALIKEFRTNE